MEGPPDPPADIIVWTAVSARLDRKSKKESSTYISAYALVWERGPFQNISQSLYGENRSNLYAEFSVRYYNGKDQVFFPALDIAYYHLFWCY